MKVEIREALNQPFKANELITKMEQIIKRRKEGQSQIEVARDLIYENRLKIQNWHE